MKNFEERFSSFAGNLAIFKGYRNRVLRGFPVFFLGSACDASPPHACRVCRV